MDYEVEQKFRLNNIDEFVRRVEDHGSRFHEAIHQADTYYRHPCRSFADTDEALRIRTIGESHRITYKGPRIDPQTKTRKELELPLATTAAEFQELLLALGFQPVATVRKSRRSAALDFDEWQFQVDLDQVDGVGIFVELETIADANRLASATAAIHSLATTLSLEQVERKSYLELLLDEAD